MEEKPKLTEEEFIRKAVKKLRGNYKGIHTVYSGFNTAFKEYFGTNPIEATQRLASEGKINIRPVKGGVNVHVSAESPGGDGHRRQGRCQERRRPQRRDPRHQVSQGAEGPGGVPDGAGPE